MSDAASSQDNGGWTLIESLVGVLRDCRKALDDDDLGPGMREHLVEEINNVLSFPELAIIDARMDEEEEEEEEDD